MVALLDPFELPMILEPLTMEVMKAYNEKDANDPEWIAKAEYTLTQYQYYNFLNVNHLCMYSEKFLKEKGYKL
jgi:hypothetical protein